MAGPPRETPLGIVLAGVGREVSRAFDDALSAAGGSLPTWLVLLALRRHPGASQRELAAGVGIQGATLTHHLNAMEEGGLVTRRRDPANRRVHIVELTPQGEAAFHRLREAAATFDRGLRAGLGEAEVHTLRLLLAKLQANVRDPGTAEVGSGTASPAATAAPHLPAGAEDAGSCP
ncbi:MarR family winged helix-turn-helix transcriptional regulator [Deinococcus apachensis]|uniref:MarR family winged helix-turn-helix transcriptional regulator n=1 Tax=Deinococcus apachensis TaxID=309886 RepID=UPI00035DBF6B|nr:MarR family winged helix-turn-helix transcriptional regulator [Deinococcus apachensis]